MAEFAYFSRLPTEIRFYIWELCLPCRVIEIGQGYGEPEELIGTSYEKMRSYLSPKCRSDFCSDLNTKMPLISRVCRESRQVALRNGTFEASPEVGEEDWSSATPSLHGKWFQPKRDIVHLIWDQGVPIGLQVDYGTDPGEDPFPQFLREAAKGRGASIRRSYIDCAESYEALEGRSDFFVSMVMVSIHASLAHAKESGLFGLLAEERVTLVEPSETERLQRLHELWSRNSTLDPAPAQFFTRALSPDFQADASKFLKGLANVWVYKKWCAAKGKKHWEDQLKDAEELWLGDPPPSYGSFMSRHYVPQIVPSRDLNKEHPFVEEALASMPLFRPVIMFRLCTQQCYRPPSPPVRGVPLAQTKWLYGSDGRCRCKVVVPTEDTAAQP